MCFCLPRLPFDSCGSGCRARVPCGGQNHSPNPAGAKTQTATTTFYAVSNPDCLLHQPLILFITFATARFVIQLGHSLLQLQEPMTQSAATATPQTLQAHRTHHVTEGMLTAGSLDPH